MTAPTEGYSIRVTSRLTAIELDTLRIWERRYGFPRPRRTDGGNRLYTESDVESLKLIRRALGQGYRPGEVVGRGRDELQRMVGMTAPASSSSLGPSVGSAAAPTRVAEADASATPSVAWILDALRRDDIVALRTGLRRAAVALGPKQFLRDVVHPTVVRVGELWAQGELEVRHEHMVSECISARLRIMMSAYEDQTDAPTVLLATLPGERHGLGLEMVELHLAASHVVPLLLGIDTPPEQIVKAARSHGVEAVALLVTHASDLPATAAHVRAMLGALPRRVVIWLGGAAAPELQLRDPRVVVASDWGTLDAAVAKLGRSKLSRRRSSR